MTDHTHQQRTRKLNGSPETRSGTLQPQGTANLVARGLADIKQVEAEEWFELGQACNRGIAERIRLYRLAANQGHADAQFFLGVDHEVKYHWLHDDAEAVEAARLYRLAADQGHIFAQWLLGCMYARGVGVPRDDREAVRWYRRAADKGQRGAQQSLSFMYANGLGVPRDEAEAARWLRMATEHGDGSDE